MEEKLKDKLNSDLFLEIKQLQLDHEALKQKILKDYDKLIAIEERFNDVNKLVLSRLTGENK
jgi:hypothetical protein